VIRLKNQSRIVNEINNLVGEYSSIGGNSSFGVLISLLSRPDVHSHSLTYAFPFFSFSSVDVLLVCMENDGLRVMAVCISCASRIALLSYTVAATASFIDLIAYCVSVHCGDSNVGLSCAL